MKIIFAILIFNAAVSCKSNAGQNKNTAKDNETGVSKKNITDSGNFGNKPTLRFDSSKIQSFINLLPHLYPLKKELDSFYYSRQYAFVWFNANGLTLQAASLYSHIKNIENEGLPDNMPYQTEFNGLMKNQGMDSMNAPSVYTELMLTAQYFCYAKNVWLGFNHKVLKGLNWYLPRNSISYTHLLDSLISGKNILDSPPVYRQYALLKNYLKKYRDIGINGSFPVIEPDRKVYKKGDSSATISAIRNWLFTGGDLTANSNSNVFDETLVTAIKRFQQRTGERDDGVITGTLINEMNVPVNTRLQQIMVNMERSRWVPVNLVPNYLVINIPEYKLYVFENNKPVWNMNVVVGKPAHETVIFNGNIKYVVFSPYWNVPPGILRKEVLPGIRRNKNYLALHRMEWNGQSVRQKPGPDNSLGLVKFLFPNIYNIYLHDTPAKSLFGESKRAFSHGCIRLAEAQKLAYYLLQNDTAWPTQKINDAMNAGKEQVVTLKNPEPVFIAYFTAWVDRQGRLNFRKDAYGRDNLIAEMLLTKTAF